MALSIDLDWPLLVIALPPVKTHTNSSGSATRRFEPLFHTTWNGPIILRRNIGLLVQVSEDVLRFESQLPNSGGRFDKFATVLPDRRGANVSLRVQNFRSKHKCREKAGQNWR